MKDVEPNPNFNKFFAGLIGCLALFFFYLAYDTHTAYIHTFVARNDHVFLAVMVAVLAGIGGILLVYALLLLRSAPVNAARLRFRSGGFRLETKQVFRGHKVADLDWADITTVTVRNGGLYGGRSIQVAHGRAGEVGFFLPTWTRCSAKDITDRLEASAEASGYTLKKEAGEWFAHNQERWKVIKNI